MPDHPVSLPAGDPSEGDPRRADEWKQSELIDEVIGQLRTGVDSAYQRVSQVTDDSSSDELASLSSTLQDLASKADAGAIRLTGAGIGDSVLSVQACRDLSSHARLAAANASEAAAADTETAAHFKLQSVRDQMAVASTTLQGA